MTDHLASRHKTRPAVRQPGTLADIPGRALARPPSSIPAADRLRAKDVAGLEACSIGTARRLMQAGHLGTVHGRNRRDRWIDRQAYQLWLDKPAA